MYITASRQDRQGVDLGIRTRLTRIFIFRIPLKISTKSKLEFLRFIISLFPERYGITKS